MRFTTAFHASPMLIGAIALSCSSDNGSPKDPQPVSCALADAAFEVGDANGHADPFGARAAGQARASRIKDGATYPQPAHGRQRIESGDFVLVNDRIAVAIEDKGLSDGYGRFGGEILAIDRVGADGKPMGLSKFNETLLGVAFDTIEPTSVSVLKDGSDGKEAIVRVTGPLKTIPFMAESLKALYPNTYAGQFAFDYVLTPGAPMLTIRYGVINPTSEDYNFGVDRPGSEEFYGFFQTSQAQMVTPETGYAKPKNTTAWAGFDAGEFGFAWRTTAEPSMSFGITQSGFQLFTGEGFIAPACQRTMIDRVQIIAGGPDYDGLRESVREALKEPAWRAISGSLRDAKGNPVADAWVHGINSDGAYLTRTRTAADGAFTLHGPPGAPIVITPQKRGYPRHSGTAVAATEGSVNLAFDAEATLHVTAVDSATSKLLPVRVQVIPKNAAAATPAAWGVLDETAGRVHQEFAVTGEATLPVPPGEVRVIVSRGYEWELFDTTVAANAGETTEVKATLLHSVDSTGVMCGDFHIHSMYSADSNDPVVNKVKGAIADGLEIPVSSEHEWVIDFQPEIVKLGLTDWAFGMASSELTTFTWGHFGVVPLTPRDGATNHGAVEWIGKDPAQVFAAAHALPEKPIVIVNHPRSEGFGGYFSASKYNRTTNTGDARLWNDQFEAIEVFNDSDLEANRDKSVADWFAFLNLGRKMVAIGSSDSHHLRSSPIGYPRTCFFFGHDDPKKLTPTAVRDAIASGGSVVNGGLMMTVSGPAGERPGQSVKVAAAGAEFSVVVESASFVGDVMLETIVNGKTIATTPLTSTGAGPAKHYEQKVTVNIDPAAARNWVVFHARASGDLAPLHPGRKPFAVSNAVFLEKP
jgi:hypothetical protein